jgi:hypothetical protein
MSLRTDLPFAMVPVWVLELPLSANALRLYAVLAGMADYSTGETVVTRKTLASKMNPAGESVSLDTVDRAKTELIKHESLSMEARIESGSQQANVYVVHRIPPGRRDAAPPPDESDGGGRTGAAPKSETSSSQRSSSTRKRAPASLNRVKVTAEEEEFAIAVIEIFNEVASASGDRTFRFASKESLGKIILRHREHPDLDVEAHRKIITEQFEHPWWKGDPSPAVIYGRGEVFDRALNGVRGGKDNGGDDGFAAYN